MKIRKRTAILVFIIICLIALLILVLQRISDDNISVNGNTYYSKEEIEKYIFQSEWDRNPYVLFLKSKFQEHKEIPFVDKYEISLSSFHNVNIRVYEKRMIGYVNYMGTNMYFDKDGTVVESSHNTLENIPLVVGLDLNKLVLGEKLPVKSKTIFNMILDITQALQKYSVQVDKLYISKEKVARLYMGNVEVNLGDNQDIDDKVRTLRDIIPNMQDLSGVLDLSTYNEKSQRYDFTIK